MLITSQFTFVSPANIQELTLIPYTAAIMLQRILLNQSLLNSLKNLPISYKNNLHYTKFKRWLWFSRARKKAGFPACLLLKLLLLLITNKAGLLSGYRD